MNWHQYRTNLKLWATGWPKLWRNEVRYTIVQSQHGDATRWDWVHESRNGWEPVWHDPPVDSIWYRKGWSPLRFTVPYGTTYLLSTLLGHPIRPYSGVLYERANVAFVTADGHPRPWSARAVRFLNWLFRDPYHCRSAGLAPILWGSRSAR